MGKTPKDNAFNPALREAAKKLLADREAKERAATASAAARPRPARTERPQERAVEGADADLFAQAMAGVERIPDKKTRVGPPAPRPARGPIEDPDSESLAQLAELVAGTGAFDIADSDEFIEGAAPGMDAQILRRLRKGDFAVQAHLDLHGDTADQARPRVELFLADQRRRGARCVLIVHGRGLHSKDQIPVLKERLRVWLAKGRLSRIVLAFCTARPQDGGAGALYVLLRR